ncbi:Hsp20/alpha crystallin family protein [Altererythrobacter lutimaris]|uniref:Hsp20/alpha crystallin family protein n=1 Tax=Altererythrobacter lutimaris TaxID=2743979 RepID=A0A850HFV5_9SPHN|nr:Hsp20/alpha crystallin family protein [Altererythrobacter lutimaris]NVE96008.1 Hsp20/alpha crystallin family protein [Altererythrobacter lutimaris]
MADETLIATKPREQTALSDYLREPFSRLRGEVDRMFDEFPPRFPASNLGIRYLASLPMPALEMKETDAKYHLAVELPGVSHDNVDISVEGDMLVLKGEKKDEREEKERDYTISERSYVAFERRVSLPKDSLVDEITATSENGVISIMIPRSQGVTEGVRKIEISTKA